MKAWLQALSAAAIGGALTGAAAVLGTPDIYAHPKSILWAAVAGALTTAAGFYTKSPFHGDSNPDKSNEGKS